VAAVAAPSPRTDSRSAEGAVAGVVGARVGVRVGARLRFAATTAKSTTLLSSSSSWPGLDSVAGVSRTVTRRPAATTRASRPGRMYAAFASRW